MAFPTTIRVSKEGKRSLKKLDVQAQSRILSKLAEFQRKPELLALNIKQLPDVEPIQCRLRIGDHRSIGTVHGDTLVLHIFIHRSNL